MTNSSTILLIVRVQYSSNFHNSNHLVLLIQYAAPHAAANAYFFKHLKTQGCVGILSSDSLLLGSFRKRLEIKC